MVRVRGVDALGLDHVSDVEQTDFIPYMVVTGDLKNSAASETHAS